MPGVKSLSDLNFFIVGAPKCGTTAMFEFLGQHPEVFLPRTKELHYFGLDLDMGPPAANFTTNPRSEEDAARYLSFFDAQSDESIRGEGSVFYLFSRTAACEIARLCPEARILVMLRNPIEVICSLHNQYLYDGNESEVDLESALTLAADRLNGVSIPPGSHFPAGLQYLDVVDFYPQVKRYIEQFGRDRVLVTLLEEFALDNRAEYGRILGFLGVDTSRKPVFRKVNRSKFVRSTFLRNTLKSPPRLLRKAGRILPGGLRTGVIDFLVSFNRVESERSPLSHQLRERIQREITPGVEELSRLLDKDLRRVWAI